MTQFRVMQETELRSTDGGTTPVDWAMIGGIAAVVAAVMTVYDEIKESVHTAGRNAAYEDLGY